MAERADVVIVGSGAAGGVAALRMVKAGLRVTCLEQGEWTNRDDYPGNSPEWELLGRGPWSATPSVRARREDYPIELGSSDVGIQNFNGVGGGMVLFAGQWPRLLPRDFRARSVDGVTADWPVSYEELAPYYDETDRQVGVSGLGGNPMYPDGAEPPLPPLPIGPAGLLVARAHMELGWHWWPEPNAILSAPYRGRHACVQRGTCMQGCNEGAKASTDLTHWPDFVRLGGSLITGATATRVMLDSLGRASGVEWFDGTGVAHFAAGDIVLLAANGIGTARLLLASACGSNRDGLANSSGLVGRGLMVHPYTLVHGEFADPLRSWQGHFGGAIQSLEFYKGDDSRGFARGAKWSLVPGGGPLRNALGADGLGVWGEEHHQHVARRFGHLASWGVLCEDFPDDENRVELSGSSTDQVGAAGVRVTYRLSDNVRRMMAWHIAKAEESLRAAGALRVDCQEFLPTGHALGTARMGRDRDTSVVDEWGVAHDVPNLAVLDGSVFVTAGAMNPTSTICALALRCADHILANRSRIPVPVPPRSFSIARDRRRPTPHGPLFHDLSLDNRERRALDALADTLIPPTSIMPAPSAIGMGSVLVDRVLALRPELAGPLRRALDAGVASARMFADLADPDREAYEAAAVVIAGAYYLDATVRSLIGYPGQEALPVTALAFPVYVSEGLLDHVVAAGSGPE